MEKQLKRTSTSLTSSTSKTRKGDDVVEDMTMTEEPSNGRRDVHLHLRLRAGYARGLGAYVIFT